MAAPDKSAEGLEQKRGAPQDPGKKIPLEAPTDQYGNTREGDRDRYPDDSPAKKGETSPPSGQGGATPHDGISHQDMWPPNPPPSESAARKGEENDRIGKGETNEVTLANERLADISKRKGGDTSKRSTR